MPCRAVDCTYLPTQRGFAYPVAIMDWHRRKVLAWCTLNTLEAEFCVDALDEAIHNHNHNHKRPHSALGDKPPAVIYWQRNETTDPDQQVQGVA